MAIIDWGAVTWGPLLYDVASSRICLQDDAGFGWFLSGYLGMVPLPAEELTALPTFARFRWAVQADYFARRIWTRDRTGLADPTDNEKGLAKVRRPLLGGRCTALKESERRGIDHVAVYSSSREWQRLIRFYDSFGLKVWYIQFFK